MKFLVLGSVNIDLTFLVDHIVLPGETISSSAVKKNAGGKGANQATALAKAGMSVYFAGKIGLDGKWILDLLNSFGVNVEHALISPDVSTGQAIILLDAKHQNSIILNAGGNKQFTEAEITKIVSSFSTGDILVLQNEINAIESIMYKAKERGMKICFNPSPFDESINKLPLHLIDYLFVNEIEAQQLMGTSVPLKSSQDFRAFALPFAAKFPLAQIVLTAGKSGAYYIYKENIFFADIVDAPVVDTTGAGDTFTGYFLSALHNKYSPQAALALASKASSITVSRPGAMQSIPICSEVY